VARRPKAALDTSDPLSSAVMIGLTLFILGVLGGLYMVNNRDTEDLTATGAADVVPSEGETPSRVPSTPPSAGQDIDQDGDTAADGESGPQPTTPSDGPSGTGGAVASEHASTTPDGGQVVVPSAPPGRTSEPGSPSPVPTVRPSPSAPETDDADGGVVTRVPAITVRTTPRDEMVVSVDLDGDGSVERVWAAIVRDQVLTRVEHATNGTWTAQESHAGGVADRLVALRAEDLTGDGRVEIYTRQWVATQGESVTLWTYRNGDLVRMPVTNGCWNNANTIGITGALVHVPGAQQPTLAAICRDAGLPPQQWYSALYVWRDGRWEFDGDQGRYESSQ
jgi:hypothetical protein